MGRVWVRPRSGHALREEVPGTTAALPEEGEPGRAAAPPKCRAAQQRGPRRGLGRQQVLPPDPSWGHPPVLLEGLSPLRAVAAGDGPVRWCRWLTARGSSLDAALRCGGNPHPEVGRHHPGVGKQPPPSTDKHHPAECTHCPDVDKQHPDAEEHHPAALGPGSVPTPLGTSELTKLTQQSAEPQPWGRGGHKGPGPNGPSCGAPHQPAPGPRHPAPQPPRSAVTSGSPRPKPARAAAGAVSSSPSPAAIASPVLNGPRGWAGTH